MTRVLASGAARAVLSRAGFLPLLTSVSASAFAGAIIQLAVSWLALTAMGSPLAVAGVFALRFAPQLIFGLAAGVVADRLERRRVIAGSNLAAAAIVVGLASVFTIHRPSLVIILILVFALGVTDTLRTASSQALAFDAVGPRHASVALGLTNLGFAFLGILGGLVGGLLFGVSAPATALLAAASYVAASGFVVRCRVAKSTDVEIESAALSKGIRQIAGNPTIRRLAFLVAATEVFGFSSAALLPTFARDVYAQGAVGLGLMVAAKSLGIIGGLLFLTAGKPSREKGPALLISSGGLGLALAVFAITPNFAFALIILALGGGMAGSVDTLAQSLLQEVGTADTRGTAMGVWLFSVGFGPIGFVILGAFAAAVGAPAAQAVSGLILLATVTFIAVRPGVRLLR